jgi:hypothetical protein
MPKLLVDVDGSGVAPARQVAAWAGTAPTARVA